MKKYIIMAAVAATFTLYSCADSFLDENSMSSYTPETLLDAEGIETSLVGLHNVFSQMWSWSDQQGWLCCWQIGTDVASPGQPQGVELPYVQYNKLTPSDGAASRMWTICYRLISNANIIITNIESPSCNLSESAKNVASAEARFFRAYAYNHLATLFGGVPLDTVPTSSAKTDYVRAPLADVNNLIISDLVFASQYLPSIDDAPAQSRANKYMAKQLLGEVYLRTGQPAKAIDPLQDIIKSGKFSLIKARYGVKINENGDYYHDMFIQGNQRRSQGNTETIWTFEVENPNEVTGGYTNAPQQRRVWGGAWYNLKGMSLCDSLGGRGLARLRLSGWFTHSLYQDGDIRNSNYNIKRILYYNDPTYPDRYGKQVKIGSFDVIAADTLYKITPYTTKWGCFDPNDTFGWAAVKDWEMMRLGETYLLLAEAYMKNQDNKTAADMINELRKRAFPEYPLKGKVDASQINLDFILDERARELIGEENRRMTLMRTGALIDRAALNKDNATYTITGLTDTNKLLPIPLTEIQLNKDAVLEQNPGYTN